MEQVGEGGDQGGNAGQHVLRGHRWPTHPSRLPLHRGLTGAGVLSHELEKEQIGICDGHAARHAGLLGEVPDVSGHQRLRAGGDGGRKYVPSFGWQPSPGSRTSNP